MRTRPLPLAAFALSACALGPTYQRPEITTPQVWRDSSTARLGAGAPDVAWWRVFRDTTLQQLIRTALARNTDYRLAAEHVREAAAYLRAARATQLPWANGYASASAGGGTGAEFDQLGANASVSWEADLFGERRSTIAYSRAQMQASEEGRRGIALLTVAGVADAFADLRAADRQIEIVRRTLEGRRRTVEVTRRRLETGASGEIDYRQAQAQYESARTFALDLEESVARTENALSVLLGRAPSGVPRGALLDDPPLATAVPPDLPARLLERRPDVRQAERQLAASAAGVGASRSRLFPRLSLSGNLSYSAYTTLVTTTTTRDSRTSETTRWSLGASLSQPLFDGGRNLAWVRAAESQVRQAETQYEATVLRALQEVEDALAALHVAADRRTSLDSQVVHTGAVLRLAEARYEGGTAPFLEVLDSQRALLSAEVGAVYAWRRQAGALIALYKALGGGWDVDSAAAGGDPLH